MSAITNDFQMIITLLVFLTGLAGLKVPIIAFMGLMMGLSVIPYVDYSNMGLIAFYVTALVANVLFFIVGIMQSKKGR